MQDWIDQENDKEDNPKSKPKKKELGHSFRELTGSVQNTQVRQTKKGKKGGRQQPQTIFLNTNIADSLKESVAALAKEWGVPMNDVWQLALVHGLRAIQEGEVMPSFKTQRRKIELPDLE